MEKNLILSAAAAILGGEFTAFPGIPVLCSQASPDSSEIPFLVAEEVPNAPNSPWADEFLISPFVLPSRGRCSCSEGRRWWFFLRGNLGLYQPFQTFKYSLIGQLSLWMDLCITWCKIILFSHWNIAVFGPKFGFLSLLNPVLIN